MEKILFSIVITAYNVENYIKECINSVLKQTYSEIEVVIVNDGSTDATERICEEYLKADIRVKVVNQTNQGIVEARKAGIENSKGQYIIFIDGDDWISECTCERFAKYLEKETPDLIIDGLIKEYAKRSFKVKNNLKVGYYDSLRIYDEIYSKMIYTGNFFEKGLESYICGNAVKRELLKDVMKDMDNGVSFAEGGVWLYTCMLRAESVRIIDDLLYHYRMRNDSMSIQEESINRILDMYENLLKNIVSGNKKVQELVEQADFMVMYLLIWKKLDIFNNKENQLYPFLDLKQDSKVVIYGAWRFGQIIKAYIEKRNYCDIVLWIDQNAEEYKRYGWDVELPDKILDIQYDYVILATGAYSVVQSMKKTLEKLGVRENILSVSDGNVVLEDLPKEVLDIKSRYLRC